MANRRSRGREINGILLLNKPVGLSSNFALQQIKRLFNAKKAGHTGSLDPLASGLLPICFGEATKLSHYLLDADKSYVTECQLGVRTTTGDAEGDIVSQQSVPVLTLHQINEVLEQFIGKTKQLPPMYSALKKNGQPLYKLARQGIEVERTPRTINISELRIVDFQNNKLCLKVQCSKGTYIRTLVEDIGNLIGCGAYVTNLERTAVGVYSMNDSVEMENIQQLRTENRFLEMDELLIPMESALSDWPEIKLSNDAVYYLRQGQAVLVPKAPTEGLVRLFEQKGEFLGIGQILDDGRVAPKRLVSAA